MMVFYRQKGEGITIGEEVRITILDLIMDKVFLKVVVNIDVIVAVSTDVSTQMDIAGEKGTYIIPLKKHPQTVDFDTLYIGTNCSIQIVNVRGDKIRIGIICVPEIPVHRIEVFEDIQAEKDKHLVNLITPGETLCTRIQEENNKLMEQASLLSVEEIKIQLKELKELNNDVNNKSEVLRNKQDVYRRTNKSLVRAYIKKTGLLVVTL